MSDERGKDNGIYRKYYDNGQLKVEVMNNQIEKTWWKNGKLKSDKWYFPNNDETEVLHVKDWYKNGVLKRVCQYKNKRLDGVCLFFNKEERLIRTVTYKNGRKDGLEKSWHNDYINTEDGISRLHFYDETNYLNGKLHGLFRKWYNGVLIDESNYLHDKVHGLCRSWNWDGVLESESNYLHDKLHGLDKRWHDNGVLGEEGSYVMGIEVGLHFYWDEDGVLVSKTNYCSLSDFDNNNRLLISDLGALVTYYEDGKELKKKELLDGKIQDDGTVKWEEYIEPREYQVERWMWDDTINPDGTPTM